MPIEKINWDGVDYPITQVDNISDLNFMEDCYFGEGGFRTGQYLERYPRETDVGFNFRKKIATFPDVFRSEFDALVDPIFSKGVTRECPENLVLNFLANPRKRLGETMTGAMEEITKTGLRLGTVFVVTSGPDTVPQSGLDDLNRDSLPSLLLVKPQQTAGYKLNERGGLQILIYLENMVAVGNNKVTPQFRVFLTDISGAYHSFLVNEAGAYIQGSYVPLNGFPVEMLEFNSRYKEYKIARPKYYNVAKKFLRMYLLTSNVDDGYWKNCFAILVYHGNADEVELGNDSILQAPVGATSPSYIAPPTDHLKQIESTMETDKEDAQEALTSAQAAASTASAEARIEIDRRRKEILTGLSEKVQAFENVIVNVDLRLFITGEWVCEIAYSREFDSVSSSDTIDVYDKVANSGMVTEDVVRKLGNKSIDILPNLSEKEKEDWKLLNESGELAGSMSDAPAIGANPDDDDDDNDEEG